MSDERKPDLRAMTAKVVAAFVAHNPVSADQMGEIISTVHVSLRALESPASQEVVERCRPAIPVKKSVQADAIMCLECGKPLKMLRRHLRADHGLSVEEYRAKWGLPADYPMVALTYAEARSQMAKAIGLGKKAGAKSVDVVAGSAVATEDAELGKPRHQYPPSRWSRSAR